MDALSIPVIFDIAIGFDVFDDDLFFWSAQCDDEQELHVCGQFQQGFELFTLDAGE